MLLCSYVFHHVRLKNLKKIKEIEERFPCRLFLFFEGCVLLLSNNWDVTGYCDS